MSDDLLVLHMYIMGDVEDNCDVTNGAISNCISEGWKQKLIEIILTKLMLNWRVSFEI